MTLGRADKPITGALWMGLSGLCFVGVYVGVKYVGTRLPAAESAFLRYALGLVFLVPVARTLVREGLTVDVIKLGACDDLTVQHLQTVIFIDWVRIQSPENLRIIVMLLLTPGWFYP